jgi:hypothetical protein
MVLLSDIVTKQRGPVDALRKHRSNERQYVFDSAFGEDSTQAEVYVKTTQPLVNSVLEGTKELFR